VTVSERFGALMNRIYDRMRDPEAFEIKPGDATQGSFEPLRRHSYAVVVTFRRTGEAVPSPVWFGLDDEGRAYVRTPRDAGKVKRIRNDSRVLLAPSTVRGKPKGTVLVGTARVLPKEEWPHAEAALAAAYGIGRRWYERVLGGPEDAGTYLEITPTPSPS
jgi:PPOX class probable F420-dependent enzyme